MKVKMLIQLNGMRNGATYPPVGGLMELKEGDTAQDLIGNKYAEEVAEPKPIIETAEAAPPETAAHVHKPTPRGSHKSFSPKKG